jgi:thiamine-phosphate pyrophosphorylase
MSVNLTDIKVYLITDSRLFRDADELLAGVEEAVAAGVKAVQFREKDLAARDILGLAYRFRELTARHGASLFINDRLDIALCAGADGVHLGQSGIPVAAARRAVGKKLLIGCSTHNLTEAKAAEADGADFITFGPIYETPSKLQYGSPVGVEALRNVSKRTGLPIFGIGGIKKYNIPEVLNSGAKGIALISGILASDDRAAAAREYLKRVGE